MSLYSDRLREAVDMTAEEFIIDLLTNGQRLVPGAAARLLAELKDVHAHELAERQRKAIESFDRDDHWAVFYRVSDVESLPDLIDSQTSGEEPTP